MNNKTLAVLHMTGDILSDPNSRCDGTLAVNREHIAVWPQDPKACRWCLMGALQLAMHKVGMSDASEQMGTYFAMTNIIGLGENEPAPLFWDHADDYLQDMM